MALLRNIDSGDTPATHQPCQCDLASAKRLLKAYVDDLLYTNDLEWAEGVSVSRAESEMDELIDRLVAPVGTCGDCGVGRG